MADTATSRYGSDRRKAPKAGDDQETLIGKGWVQGVALVMIFGFFVMGLLAYRTYTASMPMPKQFAPIQKHLTPILKF